MLLAELALLEALVDQLQRSRDALAAAAASRGGAGAAASTPPRRPTLPAPMRARDSAAAWVDVLRAREGAEA